MDYFTNRMAWLKTAGQTENKKERWNRKFYWSILHKTSSWQGRVAIVGGGICPEVGSEAVADDDSYSRFSPTVYNLVCLQQPPFFITVYALLFDSSSHGVIPKWSYFNNA